MRLNKLLVLTLCLLLVPLAASAELTKRVTVLAGHVVLVQPSATELVVTVDRQVDLDGVVDEAFVYRTDVPLPENLPEIDDYARVIVKEDSILILPARGPRVFLTTGFPKLTVRTLRTGGHTLVVLDDGIELGRYRGQLVADPYAIADELLAPNNSRGYITSQSGLSAVFAGACEVGGGEGADECSGSAVIAGSGIECSVHCREGYDACCDTGGCHCVAS